MYKPVSLISIKFSVYQSFLQNSASSKRRLNDDVWRNTLFKTNIFLKVNFIKAKINQTSKMERFYENS